jgi:hypothetical protein
MNKYLWWKYSEETNVHERVEKLRTRTPKNICVANSSDQSARKYTEIFSTEIEDIWRVYVTTSVSPSSWHSSAASPAQLTSVVSYNAYIFFSNQHHYDQFNNTVISFTLTNIINVWLSEWDM